MQVLLGSLAFLLDDVVAGNPNIRLQHSMEDTVILELDVPTFAPVRQSVSRQHLCVGLVEQPR